MAEALFKVSADSRELAIATDEPNILATHMFTAARGVQAKLSLNHFHGLTLGISVLPLFPSLPGVLVVAWPPLRKPQLTPTLRPHSHDMNVHHL